MAVKFQRSREKQNFGLYRTGIYRNQAGFDLADDR